jgi:hypothetical protein
MSYQIIKNIVETKLQKFREENDISNLDTAFMYFIYAVYNNQEYNDINVADIISTQDIVDGNQDKQIDIICVFDDEENEEATIKIFQIKKTYGFSSSILIQMKNGLDWIFEQSENLLSMNNNALFISKIKEIRELTGKYPMSHIDVEVYYVTLGNKNDIRENDEYNQELNVLMNKYGNLGFRNFEFYTEGAVEIFEKINLIETKDQKINKSISILYDINKSSLIEMESERFKSVICTVKAKEIAALVAEDKNDVLFDKNIRKYLETRGKVNQSILETSSNDEESKLFWCLNNGITLICDNFSVTRIPGNARIDVNNLQIINGCQTSVTLYNAMKRGILKENTEVLLKIHATTDKEVIDKITIATNNQNPINLRDLRSNENIQIHYQKYIFDKYGYYYERKRNEFRSLKKDQKKKIIINEKMGQAYLAIGLKKPHQALGSKSDIFKDEFDAVFKKSSVQKLMFSYLIYQFVEKKKKETSTKGLDEILLGVILYGSFHICRVMTSLLLKQDTLLDNEQLEKIIEDFMNTPACLELDSYYNAAVTGIERDIRENQPDIPSVFNYLKRKESSERMNVIVKHLLENI